MKAKNNRILIASLILIGIFGIDAIAENISWYRNLNGYGAKLILYESGVIDSELATSNPTLYEWEKYQIVLIRVLGNSRNYHWVYRYSTIPGILPTWPFVTTHKTNKNTVEEYLNATITNPSSFNNPSGALEAAIKSKINLTGRLGLFNIISGIYLTISFWIILIVCFLGCEYFLVKELIKK